MSDDFDQRLEQMTTRLARDVQPERDLWPEIESAMATKPETVKTPPLWQRYLAQAAAVVILVGGSSGLTYLAVKEDRQASPGFPTPTLNAVTANFGEHTLGPGFQDARSNLRGQLDIELDRLSPEARQDVEENLSAIRSAIDEINVALADQPNNALLQELLLSSYQEELALMRKVNGISQSVMYRDDI